MDDLISRQAAIDELSCCQTFLYDSMDKYPKIELKDAEAVLEALPTAEPTLYGYKIEHLAYIATVMEKEGVSAEYAVRTFDDIGRVIKMVIEEAREKIEEVLFKND